MQHDNATQDTAELTQNWLHQYLLEFFDILSHGPDLTLLDCHIFAPLQRHLF